MAASTFTDDTFESTVLRAGKPVLVDFWAPWCGPCHAMAPIIEELSNDLEGKVIVGKLNVDENMQTGQKYNILSIPTFLVFKDGMVVEQMVGIMDKSEMAMRIAKHTD